MTGAPAASATPGDTAATTPTHRAAGAVEGVVAAVDTGGTFTDLVAQTPGGVLRAKVPSTPDDPGRAVLDALAELRRQLPPDSPPVRVVRHGTTVATNALLERRGAATVLITTAGFTDLLRLRRQDRPDLYALHPVVPEPLVAVTLGVAGRVGPRGERWAPLEPLGPWLARHAAVLAKAESFAVCLLHAWRDGSDERAVGAALAAAYPGVPVTLSHALAPVFREYERCSTAAVNAFVAPVMGRYLARLQAGVAPAQLMIQGSGGGLLSAELAARWPAHTALSGPAGGVQGAWAAGRAAGYDRLLTLDMGGTSTDVSVVEGALTPSDLGEVAGLPVRLPLLPIDTVGAGGGSIAWVDSGGALRVGPRSAGARPGPACYGRAGPEAEATVTDAHVVLGRLPQLLGGAMPLDSAAAHRAMARLAAQLGAPVAATAQAVLDVTTAAMARACKRVSSVRGVDPRTLTLVAFGGAGGLHACELADELGCPTVLFPAEPGVLSAAGIAAASPAASVTHTSLVRSDGLSDGAWRRRHAAACAEVAAAFAATWPGASPPQVRVLADMRYVGQSWSLAVEVSAGLRSGAADATASEPQPAVARSVAALGAAFERAHDARYGFTLAQPWELVALRAFADASRPAADPPARRPTTPQRRQQRKPGSSAGSTGGRGADAAGPRAVSAWSATLWLPEGWRARQRRDGAWVCERLDGGDATYVPSAQASAPGPAGPARPDAGTAGRTATRTAEATRSVRARTVALGLEVHRHRLAAIAEQMGAALQSSALSANIKERRDFSCAIFDGAGRMLEHAAHIPVHLGSTPASVAAVLDAVPPVPGQSVIVNDPFQGGTHLPDVTVVTPVFVRPGDATPTWYVANRAHHADVGGVSPGSMPAPMDSAGRPRPLTIADEGFRIGPTVLTAEVRQAFAAASRTPSERLGDLRAQEAANLTGARLLRALSTQPGVAARVPALNEALLDYGERRMRAALQALPDGSWRFTDHLDDDGLSPQGVPVPVVVTIAGDRATVDLRAAPPASPGPLNAVRAIAVSAVLYCFRALAGAVLDPDGRDPDALPANAGTLRPLTVRTRPGSLLDARPPSAVSAGNVETSQRLVDAIFGALAQAAPEWVPAASCGSMSNLLLGGTRPTGAPWVHYETLAGGAGGGPLGPGADAVQCHMTNTRNTPVEALEHAFPLEVRRYALASQRAQGVQRGGAGVVRALRFHAPATVTLVTERRRLAPWGLAGGEPGPRGRNRLRRASGELVELPSKAVVQVDVGDELEVQTPGGGAWGGRGAVGEAPA